MQSGASSAVSSYSSMLSKAPALLGQYYIAGTTGTLGSIGENIAADNVISTMLRDSGNWISLSPRVGPQGIDHIFIKRDANGLPRGLIVGESKYNHSQLGETKKDGIQMGSRWTKSRLKAMGERYNKLSTVTKIEKAPLLGNYRKMTLVLKNGKEVCWWQENSRKAWKFSGTEEELREAQKLAAIYGNFLKKAEEGLISYRSRVFQIKPVGDDIRIIIRDASDVDTLKRISKLPILHDITLENAMNKSIDPKTIANELKKKMPHLSNKELMAIAKDLGESTKNLTTRVDKLQIAEKFAMTSLQASAIAAAMDIGLQVLLNDGEIDFARTGISGGAVFVGTIAAQGLNLGLNHWQWSRVMLKSLSKQLGCSVTTLGSTITSTAGGILTSALISYGMYFAGYSDLDTANVAFAAGSIGTLTGVVAGAATMGFATAFGTASTGTAIASLHGAAATNAALAWLGGGAVSAGGGGVAIGAIVVGGVVVVAAVAASYTVFVIYDVATEQKDRDRFRELLSLLSNADSPAFDRMIQNNRCLDGR